MRQRKMSSSSNNNNSSAQIQRAERPTKESAAKTNRGDDYNSNKSKA